MKNYKKRTIALVLASVITIAGSFGADNYKNTLMGIQFENNNNNLNIVIETKGPYNGNLQPIKKDSETYIITLPEINNKSSNPNLDNSHGNIKSINVRTMPYSTSAKGYTRITIKTGNPSLNLTASNKVYIPSRSQNNEMITSSSMQRTVDMEKRRSMNQNVTSRQKNTTPAPTRHKNTSSPVTKQPDNLQLTNNNPPKNTQNQNQIKSSKPSNNYVQKNDSSEPIYILLWAMIIILIAFFLIKNGKNKLREITGEGFQIDLNEDDTTKKKNNSKIKQIKKTINKIDNLYPNTLKKVTTEQKRETTPIQQYTTHQKEDVIVDLDELFQEFSNQTKESEENSALEDFLSGFSFNEYEENKEDDDKEIIKQNEELYNKDLFEKIINSKNIVFSQKDIACMNSFIDSEINSDSIKFLKEFSITNPIKKPLSKEKILEKLITSYTISQNIRFSSDDVNILNKLINIELDNSFIEDLRTNKNRTKEMEKEILDFEKDLKKPSDIITLNVKSLLPDLSEILKNQGNKKVESNYKPNLTYYSENYEADVIKTDIELPNLTIEINNEDSYKYKPSTPYEVVDTNYQVGDDNITISLDTEEFSSNQEPNTKDIETLDTLTTLELIDSFDSISIPKLNTEEKNVEIASIETLFEESNIEIKENTENYENNLIESPINKPNIETNKNVVNIFDKIENIKMRRNLRRQNHIRKERPIETPIEYFEKFKCIIENEKFEIIQMVSLKDNTGCYLAKKDKGYSLLGYIDEKIFKIKDFETLKSEKIHLKIQEENPNGTTTFMIRIGIEKFLINQNSDSIQYLMDLT